jgi:hypothetical protein
MHIAALTAASKRSAKSTAKQAALITPLALAVYLYS